MIPYYTTMLKYHYNTAAKCAHRFIKIWQRIMLIGHFRLSYPGALHYESQYQWILIQISAGKVFLPGGFTHRMIFQLPAILDKRWWVGMIGPNNLYMRLRHALLYCLMACQSTAMKIKGDVKSLTFFLSNLEVYVIDYYHKKAQRCFFLFLFFFFLSCLLKT